MFIFRMHGLRRDYRTGIYIVLLRYTFKLSFYLHRLADKAEICSSGKVLRSLY